MIDIFLSLDMANLKLPFSEPHFCLSVACIIVSNNKNAYINSFTFIFFLVFPPYFYKFLQFIKNMHEFMHVFV